MGTRDQRDQWLVWEPSDFVHDVDKAIAADIAVWADRDELAIRYLVAIDKIHELRAVLATLLDEPERTHPLSDGNERSFCLFCRNLSDWAGRIKHEPACPVLCCAELLGR